MAGDERRMVKGDMGTTEVRFPAHTDPAVRIRGVIWEAPAASAGAGAPRLPRGVVQIVHGMSEHIDRYDAFARELVDAGYAVCGIDLFGHGDSVAAPEARGCLPAHGGADDLLDDVHAMRALMDDHLLASLGEKARTVPRFVFGHSMGSFVVRCYVAEHGRGLSGAVVCGTGFVPVATSRAGNALARLIARVRGEDHRSPLLHRLADGGYASKVPGARTEYDWLSVDEGNVADYLADERCGFPFSAGGYATLTELTARCCTAACARAVPHDLPLLFVAGAQDPVGDDGRGVRRAADLARAAGSTDVTVRLYEGMRHEILNETRRDVVVRNVIDWLDERAGRSRRAGDHDVERCEDA